MAILCEDIKSLAPLIFVVIGWGIVNHQNNSRESRKEYRALVDSAKKQAAEVTKMAVKYYCESNINRIEVAFDIKDILTSLEIELERLPKNIFSENSQLMKEFIELSDAITGGDFESASIEVIKREDNKIKSISIAKNKFCGELENQFANRYTK